MENCLHRSFEQWKIPNQVVWTAGFALLGDPILSWLRAPGKPGKTACSWFGSALRADFPPSGIDSGAGAMGVLPSAPAPDMKSSDIHVGFSPKSTPTLGLHPSRVRQRLCYLGSKIKINSNDEPMSL
ncbi:glycosyl hydrolase family 38 protein [Pseudomonas sp. StFLB209]|nr:glycosyl hydrolase family 38 protein [Pseudomonas sp. StFLB209]